MIILDGNLTRIDHAWLDANLIDPAYADLRCRLSVGSHGGIVCDRIEGERDLSDENVTHLAEHAVVMTDPAELNRLALTDGRGKEARIIRNDDITPVDRRIIRRPNRDVNVPEPTPDRRRVKAMEIMAVLLPVIGLAAVASTIQAWRGQPMMPIVLAVGNLMLLFVIVSTIRNRRRTFDRRRTAWLPLARETERRRMLPTSIQPHADEIDGTSTPAFAIGEQNEGYAA